MSRKTDGTQLLYGTFIIIYAQSMFASGSQLWELVFEIGKHIPIPSSYIWMCHF